MKLFLMAVLLLFSVMAAAFERVPAEQAHLKPSAVSPQTCEFDGHGYCWYRDSVEYTHIAWRKVDKPADLPEACRSLKGCSIREPQYDRCTTYSILASGEDAYHTWHEEAFCRGYRYTDNRFAGR